MGLETGGQPTPGNVTLYSHFVLLESRATVLGPGPGSLMASLPPPVLRAVAGDKTKEVYAGA